MQESLLAPLKQMSARIGSDFSLIQGAGGNTSIKDRDSDCLWVKASGTWLKDALDENIFVPLTLSRVLTDLENGREITTDHVTGSNESGLRPSIEAALHAIMPHRVVVHSHSLAAIRWLIRRDGADRLTALLEGLRWSFVGYQPPGIQLAQEVLARIDEAPDVLMLANHGIVVGAESCEAVEATLRQIEKRLAVEVRSFPNSHKLGSIPDAAPYHAIDIAEGHSLAFDQISLSHAGRGSLYPDHVVFLGPGVVISESADALLELNTPLPPCVIVRNQGVVVHENALLGVEEMIVCLAQVLAGIESEADLRYLAPSEEASLLNRDVERYRQSLAVK
jgi:rhamnose utilization protein RhaD (predicted bifunctional aldolase and dehydrogenase)